MKTGTPHRVFAWVLDAWLLAHLFGAVSRLAPAELRLLPPMAWSALAIAVIYILPACYHAAWAASARFATFGERVAGCVVTNGEKRWLNPYGTSRIRLYLCLAAALFVRIGTTSPEPAGARLLLDMLAVGVAAWSMILLGGGWSWALLGVVAYRAWETAKDVPLNRMNALHAWILILAIVCTATAYSYSAARRQPLAMGSVV